MVGRQVVWLLGVSFFALGALAAGCGEPNSTNRRLTPTATASETAIPNAGIVGEWQRARTCQELVRALTRAGLEEFAAEAVGLSGLLTTPANAPAKDPEHPCADAAGPKERSNDFWDDGQFYSYDEFGRPVDYGYYEIEDADTIWSYGLRIDYETDGDTIVFRVRVPKSCTSMDCRGRAAYVIKTFYPGKTWEAV